MLWENSERQDSMEHYRDYWDNFANYPYLYYCRRCIRNFNTKVRVKLCNKCLREDIVELPANTVNVPLSRLKGGERRFGFGFLDKKLFKNEGTEEKKEYSFKESLANFAKKLDVFVANLKARNNKSDIDQEIEKRFTFMNKKSQQDLEKFKEEKAKKSNFSIFSRPREELPSYNYEDQSFSETPVPKISDSFRKMIENIRKG